MFKASHVHMSITREMIYSMRELFLVLFGILFTILLILSLYFFGGRSKSKEARWVAVKSRSLVSLAELGDDSQFFVNAGLNGFSITELLVSEMLKDADIIQKFYLRGLEQFGHGFVVCECKDYQFICHLKGNANHLALELALSRWDPNNRPNNQVRDVRKVISVKNLKDHLSILRQEFGHYSMGFRDCRHFAHSVATYLGS